MPGVPKAHAIRSLKDCYWCQESERKPLLKDPEDLVTKDATNS